MSYGEDDESENAVVIHNDYNHIQVGRAGDDSPSTFIPACSTNSNGYLTVGQEAYDLRNTNPLRHPYDGTVLNWDDMEALWKKCSDIHDLKGKAVLLGDAITNTKENQEKACELFIETFQCKGIHSQMHNILAGYASGRTTYTTVGMDQNSINICSVYEGYFIEESVLTLPNIGIKPLQDVVISRLAGRLILFSTDLPFSHTLSVSFSHRCWS